MDASRNCDWGCGIHSHHGSLNNFNGYWCDSATLAAILEKNDSWINYQVQQSDFGQRVIFDKSIEIKNGESATIRFDSEGNIAHVKITKAKEPNIADWIEEAEINQEQVRLNNEATRKPLGLKEWSDWHVANGYGLTSVQPTEHGLFHSAFSNLMMSAAAHEKMAEKQKLRDKVKDTFEVRRKLFSKHPNVIDTELALISFDAMEMEILSAIT